MRHGEMHRRPAWRKYMKSVFLQAVFLCLSAAASTEFCADRSPKACASTSEWIVAFHRYYSLPEYRAHIERILGRHSPWELVKRNNAATNRFKSDFALLRFPAGFSSRRARLRLSSDDAVRYVVPQRPLRQKPLTLRYRNIPSHQKHASDGPVATGVSHDTDCGVVERTAGPRRRRLLALAALRGSAIDYGRDVARTVGAPHLWRAGFRGQGVRVAVFDTGLASDHPHFKGVIEERTNWTNDPTLEDEIGHGTFVAGMISSNGACQGIAPDASLQIFRVFNGKQVSYTSWFLDAFNYAIATNVHVLNLSIGGPDFEDHPFVDKIREASANGIIVVSAIGNDGPKYGTLNNPADQLDVIGVGGIGNNGFVAKFSSRGMTTHELPYGYGRVKPDIVTYAQNLRSSAVTASPRSFGSPDRALCTRLSGTSVASPVVAGAVALLASTVDSQRRADVVNPASMKQVLVESAVRNHASGSGHIFEQGAGAMDVRNAAARLAQYSPRASLLPNVLDLTDCPYMWPYCTQPLYPGRIPIIANVSILNGMGVVGEVVAGSVRWEPDTELFPGSRALHVDWEYTEVLWPWTGWLALYLSVSRQPASSSEVVMGGTLQLTVVSDRQASDPASLARRTTHLSLTIRVRVIRTPPRSKRILWDQFHSLRYPAPYVPRDNLDVSTDLLDWNGDHPHTNFHDLFNFLRTHDYFIEILGQDYTCFNASQYGTLLIVDPEEEFFAEEVLKVARDVGDLGLSIVVFADWYSEAVVRKVRFFDENTISWWDAITGGANVPALNELLAPFGLSLGDKVLKGTFQAGKESTKVLSSAAIARAPKGARLLRGTGVIDQGAALLRDSDGAAHLQYSHGTPALLAMRQLPGTHSGRVAVFGDSNCIDSSNEESQPACWWLLRALIDYAAADKPGLLAHAGEVLQHDFKDPELEPPRRDRTAAKELAKFSRVIGKTVGRSCLTHADHRP